MKALKITTLIACLAIFIGLSEAKAAFVSVTPTGSFDAQAVNSISYDIFFNVEANESFTFTGWDLDLQFDPGELTNWSAANVAAGDIFLTSADTLNLLFFSFDPATDVNFTTVGAHQLATVSFDIIGPVQLFDGIADFEVLSQIGTPEGFATATMGVVKLDGALGADVGAVPIPGAVWLFGSGILGLFGLRKKVKG